MIRHALAHRDQSRVRSRAFDHLGLARALPRRRRTGVSRGLLYDGAGTHRQGRLRPGTWPSPRALPRNQPLRKHTGHRPPQQNPRPAREL